MSLFGLDIDQLVADSLSGELLPATLTRSNEGEYDPLTGNNEAGSADSTYTSEGIVDMYSDKLISDGLVEQNDRKVILLAKPLGTAPKAGDEITIDSETYTVVGVPERDPATATWIIQGRIG